jgi:hypothetical protein
MSPSRAADRGTAAALARRNLLARLRRQPTRRASAPGCDDRRFLAAGDRVLASARQLLAQRSGELALNLRSSVSPWGTLEPPPLGSRRVAAQVVGHGGRLRGASACPRWVGRSRARAPCSGPARRPPLQHTARPPRPAPIVQDAGVEPHDQLGQLARAGRGNRCTAAPPFEDARRAEGGCFVRAASASPATAGLPAVLGVASGCHEPGGPRAHGCRDQASWPRTAPLGKAALWTLT